jgi:hypothetical protein
MATNNVEMMPTPRGGGDPNPREVIVHIRVENGRIQVEPETFHIHKHRDEEVKWICEEGDGEFMIEFEDSPFYEFQYSKDAPVSGLARRAILADRYKVYKYTVRVGDLVLDPGGVIRK